MKYKYKIDIFWSEEDQCYLSKVPELKGCITHGDTIEEAARMAEDAIEGYIASLKKHNEPIPVPLSEQKFSGKMILRLKPNVHRDIALKAKMEGMSINKFIESSLENVLKG